MNKTETLQQKAEAYANTKTPIGGPWTLSAEQLHKYAATDFCAGWQAREEAQQPLINELIAEKARFAKLYQELYERAEADTLRGLLNRIQRVLEDEHLEMHPIGQLAAIENIMCEYDPQNKGEAEADTLRDAWISVKDRLPYKDGDSQIFCLVWDTYEGHAVVRPYNEYHKCWDGEDADDFYTDATEGNITHWMPLPPKPQSHE